MKPEKPTLGLYIHIPFCKQKCVYCDFYSLSGGEGRMDDYTAALCAHLAQTAPLAAGHTVDTVFFGGGTPSYLGAERLSRILGQIFAAYDLAQDAEITLEANPDSACDTDALRTLRQAGFNRLSLGMQSACNAELRAIGRVHTADQVAQAVEAARSAGLDNISLDLIYGLPGQTMEQWQQNLAAAVALTPQHLSCYGLKVEEGTPLARMTHLSIPGDDLQAEMYLYTADYLAQQGLAQYEISNFAKPGRESRHNLKYWTLGEYMGFGPGAHSDFDGSRYAYTRDLEEYIRSVETRKPVLSECEAIAPHQRDSEWLMLGLRTVRGLDPKEYERRFCRAFDGFLPFLEQCRGAGYACCENSRWHLTAQGFLLSNQIIGALLDILADEKQRSFPADTL